MPVRFLLILALLAQPIVAAAAAVRATGHDCTASGCCQVVESVTCCGETVSERVCQRSGSACRCGVQENDTPDPPAAPAPSSDRDDLSRQLLATPTGLTTVAPAAVPYRRVATRAAPRRSHQETQALLCIWRT